MNIHHAKIYVKNRLNDYLIAKGIDIKKPFRCLNPLHTDVNPSMSYNNKHKKAHCFACGADYDIFDLIGIDYNIQENKKIFKKTYEYFNVSIETNSKNSEKKISDYMVECQKKVSNTDYFHKRGLSNDIIKRYHLGYDENYTRGTGGYVWKAAIIPTSDNSFTARNTNSNASKRNRMRKQGGSPIFNFDNAMNQDGPVFIVEGELDALSVIEAGGNAIALGSVSNWRQLKAFFLKGKGFYNGFDFDPNNKKRSSRAVIISLDNDVEGIHIASVLLNALDEVFIRVVTVDISLGYKDPNNALESDRNGFIGKVRETIKCFVDGLDDENDIFELRNQENVDAYVQSSVAFSLDFFRNHSVHLLAQFDTGFKNLDKMLCGMKNITQNTQNGSLFPGLYIIGAISSLGKTTFVLQMADNIAVQGNDVLIFSLEMSKNELISKSISRHTLLECKNSGISADNAKTALEVMSGINDTVVVSAIESYGNYAQHIYINETVKSVEDVHLAVEKHISCTGKSPVVFVDYIQILGSGSFRGTDKQHMDRTVTELKRISRAFQVPVFGVSSFNRQSYKESVTMEAFKESGAIEYSSDVLIGLQLAGTGKKDFDIDVAKGKNPREVELKILKNRNGRTGGVISYSYYPSFNYFKEL